MEEGEMTQRRSTLVEEKQLAKFALTVGLNLRMRLGKGMIQTGGFQNPNLLSSAFEAVVGAYYLDHDQNFSTLRPIITDLFDSALLPGNPSYIDAKNRFQVWVQANFEDTLPRYVTDRIGGLDHAPEYLAKVLVKEKVYGEGKALGKKEAEKRAAENALIKLQK
jgi:ribonuclease-3